MKQYDVIIIGHGMAGATLAIALAKQNVLVAVIDKNPLQLTATHNDGRKIALNAGSMEILKHFSLWDALKVNSTAIEQVQISAQGQFGATRLQASDLDLAALGYVLRAEHLLTTLHQQLQQHQIDFYQCEQIKKIDLENNAITFDTHENTHILNAKLIVAADGVMSYCRKRLNINTEVTDYEQTALVSSIELEHPHHHIAYQRFTDMGTLAFLPMQNKTMGIVCTADCSDVDTYLNLDDAQCLKLFQEHFGYRLGKFKNLGPRFSYPVKMILAKQQVKQHVLLLGNAAHNISPVAAQGFNLSLQDIYCLVTLWQQESDDISSLLENYLSQRLPAQQKIIDLTDKIMQMTHGKKWSKAFIGLALGFLDVCMPLKQTLNQRGAGLSAAVKVLNRKTNAQRI